MTQPGDRLTYFTKPQFNSFIRGIKTGSLDTASNVRTKTFLTLKRLRVARNLDKAVKGIPSASDHCDWWSLMRWLDTVKKDDQAAIEQVVQLDATAVARSY